MQAEESQEEVDNKSLYEFMGVPSTATPDEIKKHFRKRAIKEHPDKGGDPEKVFLLFLLLFSLYFTK